MIQVDLRSRVPIYEQLYEDIRKLILKDILPEDDKLPSVRELASQLTINPNTIQKAYKALEKDGYIYSVSGRGNFVNKLEDKLMHQASDDALEKVCKAIEEAKLVGLTLEKVVRSVQECYEEDNK